jgi:tRNA1Val (adenine37-N6)-methyltransferase
MSFQFKQFAIQQERCAMKLGTDSILLGAWASVPATGRILDVGAGSGVLSLMLAQRSRDAVIYGVEIDLESAVQAAENAADSPWADRIQITASSVQQFARSQPEASFQLLISNPPYFSEALQPPLERRRHARHAIELSHVELLRTASRLLHPEGVLALILPHVVGIQFLGRALSYDLHLSRQRLVRPRPDRPVERMLLELRKSPGTPLIEPELVLHNSPGSLEPSEDFHALARDFYLNW